MTGKDTFEFAAAIAGVSIGLAAVLVLSIVAVVAVWQAARKAGEASVASVRAAAGMEELARHISSRLTQGQQRAGLDVAGEGQELAGAPPTQRLEELERRLSEAIGVEGSAVAALDELQDAVARLDATLSQMAANLANFLAREGYRQ